MIRIIGPFVVVFLLLSLEVNANEQTSLPKIRVCGDAVDWRPFTYIENSEVKGYDVDVLNTALTDQGISYELTLTSWSRCLRGAKSGIYDLVVSASFTSERSKDYLYTEWYYNIIPQYVYSQKQFPSGLDISNVKQLSQHRLCGNHKYNYLDFNIDNVKRVGHSISDVLDKVIQGECDIYLSWVEILQGAKDHLSKELSSDSLVSHTIPDMEPHKFYMLVSHQYEEKEQLKALLDKQFSLIRETN